MSGLSGQGTGVTPAGPGLRPCGAEPQDASQAEPLVPNAVRIAVVQGLDGYLTCCGPDDFKEGDHSDAMDAALGWHLEAGHLPGACYWIEVGLPPLPSIPELRAKAEAGEFPKSFIDELDDDHAAHSERTGA